MMPVITVVILVFVGIVIMILVHVCMVEWIFQRSSISNNNNNDTNNIGDRNSRGNTSMSKDDVESLPSFDFISKEEITKIPNNINGSRSPLSCVVCLEAFKVGEKCRLLPLCNHSFHAECVDAWLVKRPSCPICRSRADSGRSGAGEGSSRQFSDLSSISNIVAESGPLEPEEGGSSRFGDSVVNIQLDHVQPSILADLMGATAHPTLYLGPPLPSMKVSDLVSSNALEGSVWELIKKKVEELAEMARRVVAEGGFLVAHLKHHCGPREINEIRSSNN